ncbi:MAG: hypothetical protein M1404_00420 [Acidobacteria bacterium]|nr:hypothetical protein [Acidobacteriota bacterium]
MAKLLQQLLYLQPGPGGWSFPVQVLQQRDSQPAVEVMDTDFGVRPVVDRSPSRPIPVSQPADDALNLLLDDAWLPGDAGGFDGAVLEPLAFFLVVIEAI